MKLTATRILLGTTLLFGLLASTTGCNNGTQAGDGSDTLDTAQVVKVEPQDFPVNELPDSLFGKVVAVTEEKGLKAEVTKLIPRTDPLPEWLDQIVSRESIVCFSTSVLKDMPNEVEFVQTASTHFDAGNNLNVFTVNYSTRPSGASMILYGGYMDEDRSYWASQSAKDSLVMNLQGAKAIEGGVQLSGEWAGPKPTAFKASLGKAKSSMARAK